MSDLKCPICGNGELRRLTDDYETRFMDDAGRERHLTVRGVTREECSNCGEVFLDDDATQKIESARLQALRRLSPEEIKAFRDHLRKTQTEMARLLGLGEKTYARWESGAYTQNAASDRYLRLLMASEANLSILKQLAGECEVAEEDKTATVMQIRFFPDAEDAEGLLETASRFTDMLTSGRVFLPLSN